MSCSECDVLERFPCHPKHTNYKYFRGKVSILDFNKDCKKCEYMKSFGHFINQEYNDYALERCCDVDKKDEKQPEAILVNKSNKNDKIGIEVKSIPRLLEKDIKKDNKERQKENRFIHLLDNIGENIDERLQSKFKDIGINLKLEEVRALNKRLLLDISCKENKKIPIYKQFSLNKNKQEEEKFIDEIIDCIAEFMFNNVKKVFEGKETDLYGEFEDDDFVFRIGKSHRSEDFVVIWHENNNTSVYSNFIPNKFAINEYLEKYYNDCKKKFSSYMDKNYKRILLIINNNRYWKDEMVKIIKEYGKPDYIDEIWCAFYEFDDVWNDEVEDFDVEELIGIRYIKVEY